MPNPEIRCEWFALCVRPSAGVVSHPVLDLVPTCQVCADKLGLVVIPWSNVEVLV